MAKVSIKPMPVAYRTIPEQLRPGHPPIFEGGPPTVEDYELALALIEALDPVSRRWYRRFYKQYRGER